MKVAVVRPHEATSDRVDVCIVVDVLRATTTAAVLCHRVGELWLVRTPAGLAQLPTRPGGYALFSELAGVDSDLPRFDNSPIQARDAAISGRTPVLVTTNGTLAVGLAARFAGEVVLAGFVNLSAVVAYVRSRSLTSVAVMPAGNIHQGSPCAEDDGCAASIVALLRADPVDVAATIAVCRHDVRIVERRVNEPNLGADIDLCFDLDAIPVVPRIVGTGDRMSFGVVPAAPC